MYNTIIVANLGSMYTRKLLRARVVSTVDKTLKTQKPYDGLLLMGLLCLPTDRPTVHRRYDVKQRNYLCRSF